MALLVSKCDLFGEFCHPKHLGQYVRACSHLPLLEQLRKVPSGSVLYALGFNSLIPRDVN